MSLFSVLSVSASGMAAQRTRAELLVQNLANSETTRTPEGGPYRRRDAVLESAPETSPFSAIFQSEMAKGVSGVGVADVVDKDGYVAFPIVNPAEDMVDLPSAQRGFEGNVATMSAVKDTIQHSIDLLEMRCPDSDEVAKFR